MPRFIDGMQGYLLRPPKGAAPPTWTATGASRRLDLLALQRSAGNRATCTALAVSTARSGIDESATVQRTGLLGILRGGIGRPADTVTGSLQRALADDVRGQVEVYGPPDYNGLMRAIRAAPMAERRAVVDDAALMKGIADRFTRDYATTLASALLAGMYTWRNPTGNDFFRFFMMGTGPGPASPSSTMNCWESVMYAAYLVGAVSASWIRGFYTKALAEPDPNAAAYALLGWSTALPTRDPGAGREPGVGQLVFYRSGAGVPGHVAIYLGGGRIMSLWNQPRGVDSVQEVGITEISGTIHFGNPPW
jgi:hypothetical protein